MGDTKPMYLYMYTAGRRPRTRRYIQIHVFNYIKSLTTFIQSTFNGEKTQLESRKRRKETMRENETRKEQFVDKK